MRAGPWVHACAQQSAARFTSCWADRHAPALWWESSPPCVHRVRMQTAASPAQPRPSAPKQTSAASDASQRPSSPYLPHECKQCRLQIDPPSHRQLKPRERAAKQHAGRSWRARTRMRTRTAGGCAAQWQPRRKPSRAARGNAHCTAMRAQHDLLALLRWVERHLRRCYCYST
jgi:hypothetical protein